MTKEQRLQFIQAFEKFLPQDPTMKDMSPQGVVIAMNAVMLHMLDRNQFDMAADIEEFHEKFGLAYDGKPRPLQRDLLKFRHRFIFEEFKEWVKAMKGGRLDEEFDALIDLAYVMMGYAYMRGWNWRKAWARVHAKNMEKVRAQSAADSKRGSQFDVIKPKGWTPADLSDLV